MAVNPAKKTTTKTSVKKTAAKKPAAKKPAVKKTAVKKAAAKKTSATRPRKISAEERYKMIEVAAYYIAERSSFQGNAIDFWVAAEEEIISKIG